MCTCLWETFSVSLEGGVDVNVGVDGSMLLSRGISTWWLMGILGDWLRIGSRSRLVPSSSTRCCCVMSGFQSHALLVL